MEDLPFYKSLKVLCVGQTTAQNVINITRRYSKRAHLMFCSLYLINDNSFLSTCVYLVKDKKKIIIRNSKCDVSCIFYFQ